MMLLANGLNDAVIGIGRRCGQPDLAVYSIEKCVQILVERDGMEEDEAREFLEFNTFGAWVGKQTPIWVELMGALELEDSVFGGEGEEPEGY
jgi:hypothetical protein